MFVISSSVRIILVVVVVVVVVLGGRSHNGCRYVGKPWLRTNGVNTNEAAAEVNLDRLGKKARPGTFGKMKAG